MYVRWLIVYVREIGIVNNVRKMFLVCIYDIDCVIGS